MKCRSVFRRSRLGPWGFAALMLAAPPLLKAQMTFVTNFGKTNNIFTNLNEEYPHSDDGTGIPGSGVGKPNASFLFDPASYSSADYVAGSNLTTNAFSFQMTSDSSGHDFAEITGGNTVSASLNQNAGSAALLLGAYYGTSANVTFTGADGYTETFSNVAIPDFNGGGTVNTSAAVNGSSTTNFWDQTVLQVHNTGAGGTGNSTTGAYNYYNLAQATFDLDAHLMGENLTLVSVTSNGNTMLLLGLTVMAVPEPPEWILLGLGATGAALVGLGRRRAAAPRA